MMDAIEHNQFDIVLMLIVFSCGYFYKKYKPKGKLLLGFEFTIYIYPQENPDSQHRSSLNPVHPVLYEEPHQIVLMTVYYIFYFISIFSCLQVPL